LTTALSVSKTTARLEHLDLSVRRPSSTRITSDQFSAVRDVRYTQIPAQQRQIGRLAGDWRSHEGSLRASQPASRQAAQKHRPRRRLACMYVGLIENRQRGVTISHKIIGGPPRPHTHRAAYLIIPHQHKSYTLQQLHCNYDLLHNNYFITAVVSAILALLTLRTYGF